MDVLEAMRTSALASCFDFGPAIEGTVRNYAMVAERDGCPVPEDDLAFMRRLSLDEVQVMFKRLVVGGVPHQTVIADFRAARNAAA